MLLFLQTILDRGTSGESPEEFPMELLIAFASLGGAIILFGIIGFLIFGKGWSSYEEKYVEGAEKSLDALFLTIPPQFILYLSIFCAFFIVAIFGLLVSFAVAFPLGLMAAFVPLVILRALKVRRNRKFEVQLVDALVNIGNSLKAGFTLTQAFQLIQKEMEAPISQEFRIINQELRMGVEMAEALDNLLKRMPGQDLDLVVTSVMIARELGGNLSEVLGKISGTIRARHIVEGKIRALTAQGKMQMMIMCLLPLGVGFGINMIQPELMESLYNEPIGWMIIVGIILAQIAGGFWIYKIIKIDV